MLFNSIHPNNSNKILATDTSHTPRKSKPGNLPVYLRNFASFAFSRANRHCFLSVSSGNHHTATPPPHKLHFTFLSWAQKTFSPGCYFHLFVSITVTIGNNNSILPTPTSKEKYSNKCEIFPANQINQSTILRRMYEFSPCLISLLCITPLSLCLSVSLYLSVFFTQQKCKLFPTGTAKKTPSLPRECLRVSCCSKLYTFSFKLFHFIIVFRSVSFNTPQYKCLISLPESDEPPENGTPGTVPENGHTSLSRGGNEKKRRFL